MAGPWDKFKPQPDDTAVAGPWAKFAPAAPQPEPAAPLPERTWGQAASDAVAQFGMGAGSLVRDIGETAAVAPDAAPIARLPGAAGLFSMAADAVRRKIDAFTGADKAVAEGGATLRDAGKGASDYWTGKLSEQRKRQLAEKDARIHASEDQYGQAGAFARGAYESVADPENLIEQIPNLTAMAVLGRAGGTNAAIGGGAALQGGDVAAQTRDTLDKLGMDQFAANPDFQALVRAGKSPIEARQIVTDRKVKEAYAIGAAISVVANKAVPGGDTIEKILSGEMGKVSKGQMTRAIAQSALGEGTSEAVEEGGGQIASNQRVRTIDPSQSLTEGSGSAAGQGFGMGAIMGGGMHSLHAVAGPHEAGRQDQPEAEQQPTLALPNLGERPMYVFPDGSTTDDPEAVRRFLETKPAAERNDFYQRLLSGKWQRDADLVQGTFSPEIPQATDPHADLPEITGGPRTQEQRLAGVSQDAADARAQLRKEAQLLKLLNQSKVESDLSRAEDQDAIFRAAGRDVPLEGPMQAAARRAVDQADAQAQAEADAAGRIDGTLAVPAPVEQVPTEAETTRPDLAGEFDRARAEQEAKKARELDQLRNESRLPAAEFDAQRNDRINGAAGQGERAPTAMQLAMQRAQSQPAEAQADAGAAKIGLSAADRAMAARLMRSRTGPSGAEQQAESAAPEATVADQSQLAQAEARSPEQAVDQRKSGGRADTGLTQRAARFAEELRAMAEDAGWAEQGGRLLRHADGSVSGRTSWTPRAEWFRSGMQSDPKQLSAAVESVLSGRPAYAKDRRTVEGMIDWLERQTGGQRTVDEDSSIYDFEAAGHDELTPGGQAVLGRFEDFAEITDEAEAMRALGFTEEEIQDAVGQAEGRGGEGDGGEALAEGARQGGEGDQGAGSAQEGARGKGSREGLTLASYTNQDIADQESASKMRAEAEAARQREADRKSQADAERDGFRLTGSDRQADVLAAQGQQGLFDTSAPTRSPKASEQSRPALGQRSEPAKLTGEAADLANLAREKLSGDEISGDLYSKVMRELRNGNVRSAQQLLDSGDLAVESSAPAVGPFNSRSGAQMSAEFAEKKDGIRRKVVERDGKFFVEHDASATEAKAAAPTPSAKPVSPLLHGKLDMSEQRMAAIKSEPLDDVQAERVGNALDGLAAQFPNLGTVIRSVKWFGTYRMDGALAKFWQGARAITVRSDAIAGQLSLLKQYIAHELHHAIDFNPKTGEYFSTTQPELFAIETADGKMTKLGVLMHEALSVWSGDDAQLRSILDYPFSSLEQRIGSGVKGDIDWLQYETFAQLGRIFTAYPAKMRQLMPLAYEFFRKIHDEHIHDSAGLARVFGSAGEVPGAVREGAGASASADAGADRPGRGGAAVEEGTGDRASARGADRAVDARQGGERAADPERDRTRARRYGRAAEAIRRAAEARGQLFDVRRRAGRSDGADGSGSGRQVRAQYRLTPEALDALGGALVDAAFDELTPGRASAAEFHRAISEAKASSPYGAAVTVYDEPVYAGDNIRLFLTEDATAGFAIKSDGDIVSVFRHDQSPHRGVALTMTRLAIEQGGKKLDAFDTELPFLYAANGMRAVARTRWDDQYAPDGWNKQLFDEFRGGEPDVVFMVYDPSARMYERGEGELKGEYDQGMAAQSEALGGKAADRAEDGAGRLAELRIRAEQILGKDSAMVRFAERLFSSGDGAPISGRYDPRQVIEVALSSGDAIGALNHEAFHHAMEAFFTPAQQKVIRLAFANDSALAGKVMSELRLDGERGVLTDRGYLDADELSSFGFQYFAAGRLRFGGEVGRVFKALSDTLERVRNWIRGAGFNTVEDLFRALDAGKLGPNGSGPSGGKVRESRAGQGAKPSSNSAGTAGRQDDKGVRAHARRALGWLDSIMHPLGSMPDQKDYLVKRYRTLGAIAKWEEVGQRIYDTLKKASVEDAKATYDYLTTRGARPDGIKNLEIRAKAVEVKKIIDQVGQALVKRGLIPQESYEKYRDQYLPRMYLRYLLDDDMRTTAQMGGGRKPSSLGYAKERKDLPSEVREVLYGEVKDPAFLSATGIVRAMRDLFLLHWLEEISQNHQWVLPKMLVDWNGQKVTPLWLKDEASHLRQQADFYADEEAAKKARAIARQMDEAADAALEAAGNTDPDVLQNYRQMPKTARYGRLRGLWVRSEIYDDLMGVAGMAPENMSLWEHAFGFGGLSTKVTQMWKATKVALNPASQVRNFISNMVMLQLSGVPLHRIPTLIGKAANEMANGGKHFQVAKKYGITESSFSSQELFRMRKELIDLEERTRGLTPMGKVRKYASAVMDFAGSKYEKIEELGKVMKVIDAMEREGKSEEDAALEAQKWLFDYSLVPRGVRYARNAPVGAPFMTYWFKALPRLMEVAVEHPQRFLPWIGMWYGLGMLAAAGLGQDDDGMKALRASLPEWARGRSHIAVLPWRDAEGRVQFADVGYMFPWTMFLEAGKGIAHGSPKEVGDALGMLSGPIPDLMVALATGKDSFTGQDIVNEADPKAQQLGSAVGYLWNMAVPPWMATNGPIGKAMNIDATDRFGGSKQTASQVLGQALGFTFRSYDPALSRAQNIQRMSIELNDIKSRLASKLQGMQHAPDAERQKLIDAYVAHYLEQIKELEEYAKESAQK